MPSNSLEDDKQALIALVEWYRDEYHRNDFCHSELIEVISKVTDEQSLAIYEQIVDGWLDW